MEHILQISYEDYQSIVARIRTFLVVERNKYEVGDLIELIEVEIEVLDYRSATFNEIKTGRSVLVEVTFKEQRQYPCLSPNYTIIGIKLSKEKQHGNIK